MSIFNFRHKYRAGYIDASRRSVFGRRKSDKPSKSSTKSADAHKNESGKPFRKDIQALRAFAVASVVLYHLWPDRMIGGFAGVDIFFVISGYLMTISVMRRLGPLREAGNVTVRSSLSLLGGFYARRIRRLVPAALTTLAGILALSYLTGNLNVLLTNAKNAFTAATFWQNWYLAKDSLNYLQQDNLIVATQHFWSLSLEEQFYAMWPLLLILSTVITSSIVVLYRKHRIPGLVLPLFLVTIASLLYGVYMTRTEPTVAYYDTFGRVWELMVGGLIALLPAIKNYDLKLLLPYIGLGINLYSIFFIGAEGFPGWWALLPVLGTAMIIWGGTDRAESRLSFDQAFKAKPIQWIGDISYSIYLWHFPLIILLPILVHHDINGPHGRLFKVGIIILSLVLAHLSYKLIEQPAQRIQFNKSWKYYASFIVATAIVAGGAFALKGHTENRIDTALRDMHTAALDESNICFGARAILHQDKCGNPYGKDSIKLMGIAPSDNMIYSLWRDGYCKYITTSGNQPAYVNDFCIYGDKDSKKTIILFGDSHARQYTNSFDYLGVKYGIKIILLDSIGCRGSIITKTSAFCEKRYDAYKQLLAQYKDTPVIVSVLYLHADFVKQHLDFIKEYFNGKIYLLKDNPRFTPQQFSACTTIHVSCTVEKTKAMEQNDKIIQQLLKQRAISEDKIISLESAFCDNRLCYTSIGGVPVFHDAKTDPPYNHVYNTHLSATYSYTVGAFLDKKLSDMGIINDRL